jgi:hypothetical protein
MRNTTIIVSILCVAALGACKKDKKAGEPAPGTSTATAPTATKTAAADKPAGGGGGKACPDGFTNPGDVGACVKMPPGMRQDTSMAPLSGGIKRVTFYGGDGVSLDIVTEEYSSMFWQGTVDSLKAGGGFGGKLGESTTLGKDGFWGLYLADGDSTKISASVVHNDTTKVECQAWHKLNSNAEPSLETMMEICKSITPL